MAMRKRNDSKITNKFWAVAVFIGVTAILVLVGLRLFQDRDPRIALGEKPGDFLLETFSGQVIDTTDLRGKVVVINFWASWCNTCDEEAMLLEAAWQLTQKEENAEVIFLGVAYMDTETASRAFLLDYGITYPNGPDLRSEISRKYQVHSVPETYILDRGGTLRFVKIGPFASLNEVLSAIETTLESPIN